MPQQEQLPLLDLATLQSLSQRFHQIERYNLEFSVSAQRNSAAQAKTTRRDLTPRRASFSWRSWLRFAIMASVRDHGFGIDHRFGT
jgi:hypothetical protein